MLVMYFDKFFLHSPLQATECFRISELVTLLSVIGSPFLHSRKTIGSIDSANNIETSFYVFATACTVTYPFVHVSEVAAINCYACALAIAILKLQHSCDFLFIMHEGAFAIGRRGRV